MNLAAAIKTVVERRKEIILAILFGSVGRGSATPDSDIDIALLPEEPIAADARMQMMEEISGVAGRPVDLVDLRQAHGPLLRQILSTGRRLVARDSGALAELIGRSLLEQADFQRHLDYIHQTRRQRWIGV